VDKGIHYLRYDEPDGTEEDTVDDELGADI
jgi:hypothetical protein